MTTGWLVGFLPKHEPATAAGGGESTQSGFGSYCHLSRPRSSPQLLYAISVHGGPGTPVTKVPAAGTEGIRALHTDIPGVEAKRVSALYSVPLKSLQEELAHSSIAIIGVKYVHVGGSKPCALVHSASRAIRPFLDLI